MSGSEWACRQCGRTLGRRHHSGRLHPARDVVIFADIQGRFGPYVRLVCPQCQATRDYAGPVVIKPAQSATTGSAPK